MCMHLCLVGALMALACLSLAERSRRAATITNECTDREDALVPSQGWPVGSDDAQWFVALSLDGPKIRDVSPHQGWVA